MDQRVELLSRRWDTTGATSKGRVSIVGRAGGRKTHIRTLGMLAHMGMLHLVLLNISEALRQVACLLALGHVRRRTVSAGVWLLVISRLRMLVRVALTLVTARNAAS